MDLSYTRVTREEKQPPEKLAAIFPLQDCQRTLAILQSKSNNFNAAKAGEEIYSQNDILNMMALQRMMETKANVQEEEPWFLESIIPHSVHCILPPDASIQQFRSKLLDSPNGHSFSNSIMSKNV